MPEFFILVAFYFTPQGQFDFAGVPMRSQAECVAALEQLESAVKLQIPGVDFRGACIPSEAIGPSL